MPYTVYGTTTAIYQAENKNWTYAGGEVKRKVWRGTRTAIEQAYNTYKTIAGNYPTYDSLDYQEVRGVATLVAQEISDAAAAMYELYAQDLYQRVEYSKYFRITATVLSPAQIQQCRIAISHAVDRALLVAGGYKPNKRGAAWAAFNAKQLQLYDLLSMGVDSVLMTAYILRESRIVSKRSALSVSYANVNEVVSPPNVAAVNTMIGNLPTGEWLKKAPQVTLVGARRWKLDQDYLWAEKWSAVLYSGGTGTP